MPRKILKKPLKCQSCGKHFYTRNPQGKYCSRRCNLDSLKTSNATYYEYNGKMYTIRELAQLASVSYDGMWSRIKKLGYSVEDSVEKSFIRGPKKLDRPACKVCGKLCKTREANFCSKACLGKWHSNNKVLIVCPVCGKSFYANRTFQNRVKACGPSCHDAKEKKSLSNRYIKGIIYRNSGIAWEDIPKSLIEAKRLEIKSKRALKEHGINIR